MVEDGSKMICGCTVKLGTTVIGCLDVLFAIVRGLFASASMLNIPPGSSMKIWIFLILTLMVIISVLEFATSFFLLMAVGGRNFYRIKSWAPAQRVICILFAIGFIVLLILRVPWLEILVLIIFHPIVIYYMPVVSSYANQIESF